MGYLDWGVRYGCMMREMDTGCWRALGLSAPVTCTPDQRDTPGIESDMELVGIRKTHGLPSRIWKRWPGEAGKRVTFHQYISPCSPTLSCRWRGGIGCGPWEGKVSSTAQCPGAGWEETNKVRHGAVPLKLVARKLSRLGSGVGVGDALGASEDGSVEGEGPVS